MPTSVVPTAVVPTAVVPTAVVPTAVVPTAVVPTAVVPTAVVPTAVVPTAVVPTAVVPTAVVPTAVVPTALVRAADFGWFHMPIKVPSLTGVHSVHMYTVHLLVRRISLIRRFLPSFADRPHQLVGLVAGNRASLRLLGFLSNSRPAREPNA